MDGAHQRLCGDDDADVSQLFALSIAEHSRSVSLGSEPMLQKTRKPLKIELWQETSRNVTRHEMSLAQTNRQLTKSRPLKRHLSVFFVCSKWDVRTSLMLRHLSWSLNKDGSCVPTFSAERKLKQPKDESLSCIWSHGCNTVVLSPTTRGRVCGASLSVGLMKMTTKKLFMIHKRRSLFPTDGFGLNHCVS